MLKIEVPSLVETKIVMVQMNVPSPSVLMPFYPVSLKLGSKPVIIKGAEP